MKNFFEQYKDPRWQKKRLQVMERNEFQCQSCGDEKNTLNVHHRVPYKKNTNIWDYDNGELVTLCEECHKSISKSIEICKTLIIGGCSLSIEYSSYYKEILFHLSAFHPGHLDEVLKFVENKTNNL